MILIKEYAGHLVEQAKSCADREIQQQVDDSVVLLENTPETLSNYLDLAYLHECIESFQLPHWVTPAETKKTMQSFLDSIRNENDPKRLELFKQELNALMESKHLLTITNINQLLSELARIIL